MTTSAPAITRPTVRRIQLLAHSSALRTALRRALAAAGSPMSLTPPAAHENDAARAVDEVRPDALVLDADLPGLRGLTLLHQIASADPTMPIIVVAPDTPEGRALRRETHDRNVIGFLLKPATDEPMAFRGLAEEVIALIGRQRGRAPGPSAARPGATDPASRGPAGRRHAPPQVLVVASSTGGPQALLSLFSNLPPSAVRVPVLIVQHMPAAFTPILADHLTRATDWRAGEAVDDEPLTAGEIRIAPGGHHLIVSASGGRRLKLTETPPVNFCRPSADVLFVSAAEVFGHSVLAVILTGMGNDGCEGGKVITAAGGVVYAQDRETSVVWGMPGAAVSAGIVDKVCSLEGMAAAIRTAMTGAG
ncbi:chemotaxis protein CheB [Acuticoccus mangrovi]|uniref:protein-glutamate methylesterase n=1 Tax=Acuticoccus mangrovi TaxID=2796142 RepID=A0A934IPG9_9HYPH|nr:chemotaxis protein CheB [Acuticoccus mangrovi]MBJ3778651.1 response regulator [Acuticoccus mangrovi]